MPVPPLLTRAVMVYCHHHGDGFPFYFISFFLIASPGPPSHSCRPVPRLPALSTSLCTIPFPGLHSRQADLLHVLAYPSWTCLSSACVLWFMPFFPLLTIQPDSPVSSSVFLVALSLAPVYMPADLPDPVTVAPPTAAPQRWPTL